MAKKPKKSMNKEQVKAWALESGVEIINYAPLTGKFDVWVTLNPYFNVKMDPNITVLQFGQSPSVNNIMVLNCVVDPLEEQEEEQ